MMALFCENLSVDGGRPFDSLTVGGRNFIFRDGTVIENGYGIIANVDQETACNLYALVDSMRFFSASEGQEVA